MPKNKRAIATDLKRLDEHIVRADEYDDAPELTDEQLARADLHEGGRLIRRGRGRPPSATRKQAIKFRLDPDLVAQLRASGAGWQTRVNAVLREAVLGDRPVGRPLGLRRISVHKAAPARIGMIAPAPRKSAAPAHKATTAPAHKAKSKKATRHARRKAATKRRPARKLRA